MEDRSIRISGGSGLFFFVVLCSYANFRTSYKRIGGINYTIYPGEWVCRIDEMTSWFRTRFQYQVLSILDTLQNQHLITYTSLGRGRVIKYKITGWRHFNTILDYNAPCQKDTGFFFLPISKAAEIISSERCSVMDVILDLWMNTVYNDEQVQGSAAAPVVYMRNGTGSPLTSYAELALRWGQSKATVGRILKKLERSSCLTLLTFPGRHGSVISLSNYLSTMFQISDVLIDKDEIAMSLSIKISVPENGCMELDDSDMVEVQLCVSSEKLSVSKPHMRFIVQKVSEMLAASGLSCCGCSKSEYKLSQLSSACGDDVYTSSQSEVCYFQQDLRFSLEIICERSKKSFLFELCLVPLENNLPGRVRDE